MRKWDNKVKLLKPSQLHCWAYYHPDGVVTIYVPESRSITVERANWLLGKAQQNLLMEN